MKKRVPMKVELLKQRKIVVDWLIAHQNDGVVTDAWRLAKSRIVYVKVTEYGLGRQDQAMTFFVGPKAKLSGFDCVQNVPIQI